MESFSSLTITIFPSFKIKKTNEIIQRILISNIVFVRENKIFKEFQIDKTFKCYYF